MIMTIPGPPDEFQQFNEPKPVLARGRLMAVDWANGTARMHTPTGAVVDLRFPVSDIDMENRMRKLATCHVDVWGNRLYGDGGETINVKEIGHAWLEPEPPREPKDGPISDEEWDEYMRAIQESREGLCGECRRRAAVA